MVMGGLFLADNLGYVRIDQMWPLILIGIGLFMLWNRMRPGYDYGPWWGRCDGRAGSWVRCAGFEYDASSLWRQHGPRSERLQRHPARDHRPGFQGRQVSCVFGGVTSILPAPTSPGESARARHLGGIRRSGGAHSADAGTWKCAAAGVFGGFSDQTMHPPATPETKRLIVKGGAVFGGVTIKN